jgi:hypothetical protein
VPGAYYSDPASVVFNKLEEAIDKARLGAGALGRLAADIERQLPSPTEIEIEQMFGDVMQRLGVGTELNATPGKRVALRMVVTIASTLSQPVIRESGVMRLPQTIRGLFDLAPKRPETDDAKQKG